MCIRVCRCSSDITSTSPARNSVGASGKAHSTRPITSRACSSWLAMMWCAIARDSIRSMAPGAGICGVDRRGATTSSAGRPGHSGKMGEPGLLSSSCLGAASNFSSSELLNSTRSANSRMLIRWPFPCPRRLAATAFTAGLADRVTAAADQLVPDLDQLATADWAGGGRSFGGCGCMRRRGRIRRGPWAWGLHPWWTPACGVRPIGAAIGATHPRTNPAGCQTR